MIGRSCWNCRQATENGQLEPSSRMYSWWIRLGSNHAKLVTRGCADIRHSGEMISLPLVRLRDEAPCHISWHQYPSIGVWQDHVRFFHIFLRGLNSSAMQLLSSRARDFSTKMPHYICILTGYLTMTWTLTIAHTLSSFRIYDCITNYTDVDMAKFTKRDIAPSDIARPYLHYNTRCRTSRPVFILRIF